jgi:hypothetical protein
MSEDEIRAGRSLVTDQVRELATELAVPLEQLEWSPFENAFTSGEHTLVLRIGGQRVVLKFLAKHLEDHASMEWSLRQQVRRSLLKHGGRSGSAPSR